MYYKGKLGNQSFEMFPVQTTGEKIVSYLGMSTTAIGFAVTVLQTYSTVKGLFKKPKTEEEED